MFSILAVLVISLVLVFERSYRLWVEYDLVNSDGFMAMVQKMVTNNSIENAIRLCKKARPKLLPYVLSEGLKRANDSVEEIELGIEHAMLDAIPKVNSSIIPCNNSKRNDTWSSRYNFRTDRSFSAVAKATGAQKQELLAEGIAEALNATSFD